MKSLELFSGCGGLAKGLELSGFTHCGFVEINKWACATLRLNFAPALVHETDIQSFDFSSYKGVDLIAGGPPCQPFSLGGLARAYNDQRDMFPQAIRAIRELHPKGFLFENVKGLLRGSFADYFEYIILRLTFPDVLPEAGGIWQEHLRKLRKIDFTSYLGLKYRVEYKLVNAADYGVPQKRERVFIIGLRNDLGKAWTWPQPTSAGKLQHPLADVISKLPDPRTKNLLFDHKFINGARSYPGHTGSDLNKPSKTIKAGAHGVPGGENMIRFPDGTVRYMTIREAKLVQTFPPSYRIFGGWTEALRQIGNAVPVELARIMGSQMYATLAGSASIPLTNIDYPPTPDSLPVAQPITYPTFTDEPLNQMALHEKEGRYGGKVRSHTKKKK